MPKGRLPRGAKKPTKSMTQDTAPAGPGRAQMLRLVTPQQALEDKTLRLWRIRHQAQELSGSKCNVKHKTDGSQ